ncbi:hypothetical protein P689_12225 [Candidatus Riesia pediculischaeffi PTSU]|uniref:Uncharacterized protein n=1 Tax=Candidatus Riesia pediculischaeffi PTSU TaxID=1401651 RepID=A0A0C1S9C5_9ENTR|nr:hypothetical protein P689_12225 [Candidatus Riesia pediculischaeffi PTSU]
MRFRSFFMIYVISFDRTSSGANTSIFGYSSFICDTPET